MAGPRVHIDLDAIVANWRGMQHRAGKAVAAAVVKADAYGLGAEAVGKALVKAGCRRFYVAWPHEGGALRRAIGANAEIFVFHGPTPDTLDAFYLNQLQPVLNHLDQIDLWIGSSASVRPAAIHVDVGMNRLGLAEADWAPAAKRLSKPSRLIGHLACGDEPDSTHNKANLEAFARACEHWPAAPRSLAATGGVYLGASYHFEEVRPGIGLYGGGPTPADGEAPATVVTLSAPILQIRNVERGATVGYGASWTAERDCRLATVGLGYADGFIRAASNRGIGFVGGVKKPIIGRISMDLIVLDVTGLEVKLGDAVEFIGSNVTLAEQAEAMGTIDYEILTRLGMRVERIHLGGE